MAGHTVSSSAFAGLCREPSALKELPWESHGLLPRTDPPQWALWTNSGHKFYLEETYVQAPSEINVTVEKSNSVRGCLTLYRSANLDLRSILCWKDDLLVRQTYCQVDRDLWMFFVYQVFPSKGVLDLYQQKSVSEGCGPAEGIFLLRRTGCYNRIC